MGKKNWGIFLLINFDPSRVTIIIEGFIQRRRGGQDDVSYFFVAALFYSLDILTRCTIEILE